MVIQAYLFLEKKLERKNSEQPPATSVENTSHPTPHVETVNIACRSPPVVLQMSGNPQTQIKPTSANHRPAEAASFTGPAEQSKISIVNRKRSADSLNAKSRSETLGESSKIAKTDYDDDDDFFIGANRDDDGDPGSTKILEKS